MARTDKFNNFLQWVNCFVKWFENYQKHDGRFVVLEKD